MFCFDKWRAFDTKLTLFFYLSYTVRIECILIYLEDMFASQIWRSVVFVSFAKAEQRVQNVEVGTGTGRMPLVTAREPPLQRIVGFIR